MDEYLPALTLHLLHPVVVVLEVLLDWLFGEIINFVDFILVLRVALEGLVEKRSARANGCDSMLVKHFLSRSRILIANIHPIINIINLWVLLPHRLVIPGLFGLDIVALLANGRLLRNELDIFLTVALVAGVHHLLPNHPPRTNYYIIKRTALIIFITIMSRSSSLEVEKIDNIAERQYKLYDFDLFKSQLKAFHVEAEGKNEEEGMQEEFFPITHQEKSQQYHNFSVQHSFEGMNQESVVESNKALVEPQQKGTIREDKKQVYEESEMKVVEAWENRPRKCSNPRFLENTNNDKKDNQPSQLVQQLQILSKERAKYRQTNYFSKKERTIAAKSIEDLFQSYKDNVHCQSTKEGVNKIETPKNNHINAYLVPSSPLSKKSNKNQVKEQLQRQKEQVNKSKECELCEKTKQRVQMHKFWKAAKELTPKHSKQEFQPEKWQIGTQPRIKRVNPSPSTSPVKYLANQQKHQYTSELSSSVFRGQVPLKEEYFQENRLRDQYLRSAKQRSQDIQKELEKLKYPRKLGENGSKQSSSRKKIFALSPAHRPVFQTPLQSPKIQEKPKQIEPPPSPKVNESKPPIHHSIFSPKPQPASPAPSKRANHSLTFKYERQALVHTRIKIFNNSKQKLQASKQKSSKNSKCKIFNKPKSPQKSISPRKNQILHNFNLLELSYQTRQWFQRHQREILAQTDKIYSYELITRYISQNEIQVRLGQFVKGMIEPKRWILLMVDSVYARLKDRYLPS